MPDNFNGSRTSATSQPFATDRDLLPAHGFLRLVVIAIAYFLTGWLGLSLAIPPGYATAIWPPSGIALAGVLGWGSRVWPGIWMGSFAVNVWVVLMSSASDRLGLANLAVAASIGAGSTLQALVGASLLARYVGVHRLFERGTTILAFASIEALSCLLAPTWGVTSLRLAGAVNSAAYLDSWVTWFLGDLMGVLVVAPVALTWRQLWRFDFRPWQLAEAIGTLALPAAITALVFIGPSAVGRAEYPLAFLPLPCLAWVAFRFHPGGVALAASLLSGIAVAATSLGSGPFVREAANESLLLLQTFTGLATLTGLTLAAAVSGQKQSEKDLQSSEERLRLFIAHAPAAIAMFDRGIHYIEASRRWLTDYGLDGRDLRGQSHYEIFPDIPDRWRAAHCRGLGGEVVTAEADRFDSADGKTRWLRWEVRPWYEKAKLGGIIIFTEDITEREQAREHILRLNTELEERIRERTAELSEANGQLRQAILLHRQAEEKANQLALTDELTGLYNRRGFLLFADQKWKIAIRMPRNCVLAYIDLDGLKQVNDIQGHAAGDAFIVDAAGVLSETFRESDVVARLGGDEFAVFAMVEDQADAAVAIYKRLQAKISEFNQQAGRPYRLLMSVGIQELPSAGDILLQDLLKRADQAMYAQKRENRERRPPTA